MQHVWVPHRPVAGALCCTVINPNSNTFSPSGKGGYWTLVSHMPGECPHHWSKSSKECSVTTANCIVKGILRFLSFVLKRSQKWNEVKWKTHYVSLKTKFLLTFSMQRFLAFFDVLWLKLRFLILYLRNKKSVIRPDLVLATFQDIFLSQWHSFTGQVIFAAGPSGG